LNIYNRKQQWKIWLSLAAALFVAASLWYSNEMVKKIASDERRNVELWADVANANHGATLRFGGYDNGSSGAYKSWNIGTPGSNLYFLDILTFIPS
jgi:hypothetical protein